MSEDDKKAAPAPAGGIGGDTAIRINVKHVLAAAGVVVSLAFGMAKWLYEKTQEDIKKNQEQIEELHDKLDEIDDRVRDNGHKIGQLIERQEAARKIAALTDLEEDEARTILDAEPAPRVEPRVRTRRPRGTRGTRVSRPFAEPRVARDPLGDPWQPRADLYRPSDAELRARLRWLERRVAELREQEREPPTRPAPDRDDDGLADDRDKCPDEPEVVNGYEDKDGCPDEVPMMVGTGPAGEEMPAEEAPEPTETAARVFRMCMRDPVVGENLGEICRSCAHMGEQECQSKMVRAVQEWRRRQRSGEQESAPPDLGPSHLIGDPDAPPHPGPPRWGQQLKSESDEALPVRRRIRLCRRTSWHLACGRPVVFPLGLDAASDAVADLQKAERPQRGRRRRR